VRSAAEILATLDAQGALDSLPFMPEMLRYIGRRYTVSRRVEKVCDTATGCLGSRRMRDTVFLDGLRCDGSGHGGCQAACRLYWKEAWLERAGDGHVSSPDTDLGELEQLVRRTAMTVEVLDGAETELFRCQATAIPRATEQLSRFGVGQYTRELTSGNVGIGRFLRVLVRAVTWKLLLRDRRLPVKPRGEGGSPFAPLGLQPGDWVQVRSADEIATTLDASGKTRGLWFDTEMLPYCGGIFRVEERIERIVDEHSGRMLELSSDCFVLEGVVCSGERSRRRWFCGREITSYWREAWLRRVDAPEAS
jgi:hypothetical protein